MEIFDPDINNTDTNFSTFSLTLDCGHPVYVTVRLRNQYPTDKHYVRCPACRELLKDAEHYTRVNNVPSAWRKVLKVEGVSNGDVHNVRIGSTLIMREYILRVQPNVPTNRARPFPYKD